MDIEIIGYIAGATVALALTPQVIRCWKTKSTKDISIVWTLIYIIGLSLWILYGIGIQSWPLTITTTVEALLALILLILKLKYK